MRAAYENIESKKGGQSFVAYHRQVPSFPFQWHYHPEYELTLIVKGNGKRLVGDSYHPFTAGDLVLLGPGLPHTWASDESSPRNVSAVVIQFPASFIDPFLGHSELDAVGRLLQASRRGLCFASKPAQELARRIQALPEHKGATRITELIGILDGLAARKYSLLASEYYTPAKGGHEQRINKVCQYILRRSAEEVTLQKAAALVHLSDSAFCKFFRRATGKTFSDYVNEVRTGHAAHLLMETDRSISEIAFEAGFESLTYFNRVFLRKKGMQPGMFRKKHSGH